MKKIAKKKEAAKPKVRVRKVVLNPKDIVRVVAHPEVHPLVVHKEPGTLDIVPLPAHKEKAKTMGWMEYLFGK